MLSALRQFLFLTDFITLQAKINKAGTINNG